MSDLIEVDLGGIGGSDEPPGPKPSFDSRWGWFGLGLGLGLLVAALLSVSSGQGGVAPGASDGTTTTTTEEAVAGVADVIPEFPDGLSVLTAPGDGRALEILTWPLRGEPTYRSIPLGDFDVARSGSSAEFDSSGHFLAAITSTRDGEVLLHVGRPNTFAVIASGISSFAWHDADAADLAWTKDVEGEFQVWVSDDRNEPAVAFAGVGIGRLLHAWGEWGFALAEVTGLTEGSETLSTVVFSPAGEVLAEFDGWVVASHESGQLLVADRNELRVIRLDDPGSPQDVRVMDLADSAVLGGEFSPSGDRVAISGFTGVSVVDFEVGFVTNHSIRAGSNSIRWSSDGRFLLVGGFRGVSVVDTNTGGITSILDQETTRAVAAAPIGS